MDGNWSGGQSRRIGAVVMRQERAGHKVQVSQNHARIQDRSPSRARRPESRRLALWLPVAMGLGVWQYFHPAEEPPAWLAWAWLVPALALLLCRLLGAGRLVRVAAAGLFALGAGYGLASWSAERAGAPMLEYRLGATVEGRVIGLSRARSGAPRVLLDRVTIFGRGPETTPERVRLALLEAERGSVPGHGTWLRAYAVLLPPGGPVEPGGFDFRRRAFFDRIGAVGFVRGPHLSIPDVEIEDPARRERDWAARQGERLGRLRRRISDGLIAALPGAEGAFAAAIVTGDRSAIEEAHAEALRLSNLAHLLAISGLHMGILTGLIFVATRLVFALTPGIADRLPAKKIAAMAALLAGIAYLLLSGATVATQRALIMVGVFYVAVLLDRPALSLRALGLAAVIILAIRPVSLLEVGFQMSFAATLALVAGYEELRRRASARDALKAGGRAQMPAAWLLGRIGVFLGALLLTSALAGAATAPIAAYHFNRTAPWGIVANLAAVPAMGLWVAPMAVISGLLAPFGLEGWALAAMGKGIAWILAVAETVAGWPGAGQPVRAAPGAVLGLVVLGGLWLALWQGRWRYGGLVALVLAMTVWSAGVPERPALLVAPDARLLGVLGPQGRALDRARGQGFAAEVWLRRDGDPVDQEAAAARPGFAAEPGQVTAMLPGGWRAVVMRGRAPAPEALAAACRPNVLLISPRSPAPRGPCRALGRDQLRAMGAVAVHVEDGRLRLVAARRNGQRPWSPPAP